MTDKIKIREERVSPQFWDSLGFLTAESWRDRKSVRRWKSRDRVEKRFPDMKDNEQPVDVLYPEQRFNSTRDAEFRMFMRRYFENQRIFEVLNEK